ncbi:hypothetical protein DRP05_10130 [Archaeoglobales archaeon]|nr:MAG: hypothetical protein DRP05_10130 [Archaeoglobales archaeon]
MDDLNFIFDNDTVNETLFSLLKAHETFNVKIGVICIMTDLKFTKRLDASVGSIFHADEIYFPLYSKEEIKDILLARVKAGFYDNVLTDEAFDLIVDLTYKSADLRLGIFLLKLSGLEAEKRAKRKIEVEDVEEAYLKGKGLFLDKSLSVLTSDERKILKTIYEHNVETTSQLYELVDVYYEKFNEILKKLENVKLIDLKIRVFKG